MGVYRSITFTCCCSTNVTAMVLESYYRLEAWGEELPRLEFAITVGIASLLGVFAASLLLAELTIAHAIMMGVTNAIAYYMFDPR